MRFLSRRIHIVSLLFSLISAGFLTACSSSMGGVDQGAQSDDGGSNSDGPLIDDDGGLDEGPDAFVGPTAKAVSAGGAHACAITVQGAVKCWGYNGYGQLGNGSTMDSATPVDVVGLSSGVISISAGDAHTCVVTTVGGIKCWGSNYYGQLGDGNGAVSAYSATPVDVTGLTSGMVAVGTGYDHTCGLTTGGGVKCWGSAASGQLGNGASGAGVTYKTPSDVGNLSSGVASLSAGAYHTCVLTTGGGVRCWGSNTAGQLGNSTTSMATFWSNVQGLTSGVTAMSANVVHTCAMTMNGGLKCWGNNDFGQLGNGNETFSTTPVAVMGLSSGVTAMSHGGYVTCALDIGGTLKCCGWNAYGQFGNGTTTNSNTPITISGLPWQPATISEGKTSACALTTAGRVKCWGGNDYGQVGNGTSGMNVKVLTPEDVIGF